MYEAGINRKEVWVFAQQALHKLLPGMIHDVIPKVRAIGWIFRYWPLSIEHWLLATIILNIDRWISKYWPFQQPVPCPSLLYGCHIYLVCICHSFHLVVCTINTTVYMYVPTFRKEKEECGACGLQRSHHIDSIVYCRLIIAWRVHESFYKYILIVAVDM